MLWWTALVLVTLVVAGLVGVVAPGWLSERAPQGLSSVLRMLAPPGVTTKTVVLPDDPWLAGDIFFNNFLIVLLPMLGGWLAGLDAGRRRLWLPLLLGVSGTIVGRSLLAVASIGGADPSWLLDASRWWVLELGALACSASAGVVLARARCSHDERMATIRRGLGLSIPLLALAAVVEVFTA